MSEENTESKKTSRRSMLRLAVPAAAGVAALSAVGATELLHAPTAHAADGGNLVLGSLSNAASHNTALTTDGSNPSALEITDSYATTGVFSYGVRGNSQNTAVVGFGGNGSPTLTKTTTGVYGIASHNSNDANVNNGYGVIAQALRANAPLLLLSDRTGYPNNSAANGSVTVDGNNGSMYNVRYSHWYPLASVNLLSHPIRIIDTRGGAPITNGSHPLNGGATLVAQITGTSVGGLSVPAHATAIIANMTALPFANGDLTIWADGVARPASSNLNYTVGANIANFVICALSPAGKVDIYAHVGSCHVILDVAGYII